MGLEGHFEFLIQPLYQEEPTRRPIGRRHDEKKTYQKTIQRRKLMNYDEFLKWSCQSYYD